MNCAPRAAAVSEAAGRLLCVFFLPLAGCSRCFCCACLESAKRECGRRIKDTTFGWVLSTAVQVSFVTLWCSSLASSKTYHGGCNG